MAQLQNVADDRPLVMAEVGLDSRRHGEIGQAETVEWQIRTVFEGGWAGVFVFAWTDEWYRGGYAIEDWDFGLTRRNRDPKPVLTSVRTAFAFTPFPPGVKWPRISVVVCTHNGSRTIHATLNWLGKREDPAFHSVVVDDGSTDHTAEVSPALPVPRIRPPNRRASR